MFNMESEVLPKLLQSLNPHRPTGPDAITTRFLQELASELSLVLTCLWTAFLYLKPLSRFIYISKIYVKIKI